jgi:hypothetical protein
VKGTAPRVDGQRGRKRATPGLSRSPVRQGNAPFIVSHPYRWAQWVNEEGLPVRQRDKSAECLYVRGKATFRLFG